MRGLSFLTLPRADAFPRPPVSVKYQHRDHMLTA